MKSDTYCAVQSKDITAVLARDAFLVFRALCKLSTRSSESSTGADPTAIRGKVRLQAHQRNALNSLFCAAVLRLQSLHTLCSCGILPRLVQPHPVVTSGL